MRKVKNNKLLRGQTNGRKEKILELLENVEKSRGMVRKVKPLSLKSITNRSVEIKLLCIPTTYVLIHTWVIPLSRQRKPIWSIFLGMNIWTFAREVHVEISIKHVKCIEFESGWASPHPTSQEYHLGQEHLMQKKTFLCPSNPEE